MHYPVLTVYTHHAIPQPTNLVRKIYQFENLQICCLFSKWSGCSLQRIVQPAHQAEINLVLETGTCFHWNFQDMTNCISNDILSSSQFCFISNEEDIIWCNWVLLPAIILVPYFGFPFLHTCVFRSESGATHMFYRLSKKTSGSCWRELIRI